MSQECLGRLNDETLVCTLRKPTMDGRMELVLTPNGVAGPLVETDHAAAGIFAWMLAYFILSMVFAFALKGRFGVAI